MVKISTHFSQLNSNKLERYVNKRSVLFIGDLPESKDAFKKKKK